MPKKKKKWPIIVAVCVGVGALVVWGLSSFFSSFGSRVPENVLTATAQTSVIDSTVVGSGTLGYAGSDTVTIPAGVEITSVFCNTGEEVAAGDVLAGVDAQSCEVLMSETYDEIAQVEEKMRSTSSEPKTLQVTAPVGGRIESISVHDGSAVLDAIVTSGSLVTISPAGQMGVEVETENPPAPGTEVLLVFPDGVEKNVSVASVEEGAFTLEGDALKVEAGTIVEVRTLDGASLGTGSVEALDAVSVVAPAGTVEGMKVEPGETVESGSVLFSVRCADPPAEYQELEQQRQVLTKRYDKLSQLLQQGGLVSPVSGIVVDCLLEEGGEVSGGITAQDILESQSMDFSPEDAMSAFGMGTARGPMQSEVTEALGLTQGGENILLSVESDESESSQTPEETETPQPTEEPTEPVQEPSAVPTSGVPSTSEPTLQVPYEIPNVTVPLIPPIPGLPLQHRVDVLPLFQGEVTWTPDDEQAAFSTAYTAHVSLKAINGFVFSPDCTVTVLNADAADVAVHTEDAASILTFSAEYEKTMNAISFPDVDWNLLQSILGGGGMDLSSLGSLISSGALPMDALSFDPSALYASAGFDPSSMYDMSALNSALGESASAYSASGASGEAAAYTIASGDRMQLSIDINQMDILAVQPGMACRVSVDALEGEEFQGTVKEVSLSGNVSGSYTAVIEVEKAEGMLSGMTASAVITTSETESGVTIPVAALQEDGNRVFVYTSYADGVFGGEMDVETGVSNGSNVEVLEGLSAGETVYYPGEDFVSRMMRAMGGRGRGDENASSVPEVAAVETQAP